MKSIIKNEKRIIAKTICYRIYQSFLISPIILYLMTGNDILSISFGIIEFVVKLFSYYIFEKIWHKVI